MGLGGKLGRVHPVHLDQYQEVHKSWEKNFTLISIFGNGYGFCRLCQTLGQPNLKKGGSGDALAVDQSTSERDLETSGTVVK